jgi:hypothetical protein
MSHFYAKISESARKTQPTARGHKSTGVKVEAASWAGKVTVELWESEGSDWFRVMMDRHEGEGDRIELARGLVGKFKSVNFKHATVRLTSLGDPW